MKERVYDIFRGELVTLKVKYYWDMYYIKEQDEYYYIYYMPFANFNLMHHINIEVNSYLREGANAKVVCLENCVKYVRKYLDDKVEVICVSVE